MFCCAMVQKRNTKCEACLDGLQKNKILVLQAIFLNSVCLEVLTLELGASRCLGRGSTTGAVLSAPFAFGLSFK
jgi:hypothetical protein